MTGEQITISISLITVGVLLYNFFVSRKKDIETDTQQFTKVNMKLDEICRTTSDIKLDARETSNKIENLMKTQIRHGEQIAALTKAVDELQEKNK